MTGTMRKSEMLHVITLDELTNVLDDVGVRLGGAIEDGDEVAVAALRAERDLLRRLSWKSRLAHVDFVK